MRMQSNNLEVQKSEGDDNSCVERVYVEAYSKKDAAGKAVSELMGKYDPFTHVFEVYNCELV